jgi:hypothetical protein
MDGDYSGSVAVSLGKAACVLRLRDAAFELGCHSASWQSAQTEFSDGSVARSGSTLSLMATRRYWKRGGSIALLDSTPARFDLQMGSAGGKATLTGNVAVGPMTLVRP